MRVCDRHRSPSKCQRILVHTSINSQCCPSVIGVCVQISFAGTCDDWRVELESTWIAYKCTISVRAQSKCAVLDFSPVFRLYHIYLLIQLITLLTAKIEYLPHVLFSNAIQNDSPISCCPKRCEWRCDNVIVISISVVSARYWHSDSTGQVYTHTHTHIAHSGTILQNTYTWTFYSFCCRTVLDNSFSTWVAASWARHQYHANDCRHWKVEDRMRIHDYYDFYYFWTGREKQKQHQQNNNESESWPETKRMEKNRTRTK